MVPKTKQDPESVVKEIKRKTAVSSIQKKKSGSYWKACEEKQHSQYLSKRRYSSGHLLQMEQGISGGRQTATQR